MFINIHFIFYLKAEILSGLGGRNDAEVTRRVISSVIGHELALQMNWVGSATKKAIADYKQVIRLVTGKFFHVFSSVTFIVDILLDCRVCRNKTVTRIKKLVLLLRVSVFLNESPDFTKFICSVN